MIYIGLFLSLLIGIVLGLVGGGGSILTVPLVNYFFDTNLLLATTYSLFVVAVAAAGGVIQRIPKGQIDFKKGILFVIPSMLTAFSIRMWIMPLFPITFSVHNLELSRDFVITFLLVIVMIYTGVSTLRNNTTIDRSQASVFTVGFYGILTGTLSGFIGAGGGFIIVPILLRLGLDMKQSVGTSMFIIVIQSLVALIGDFFNPEIYTNPQFDWVLLLIITFITVIGVLIGTAIQKKFNAKSLRRIFSLLILAVALGLIAKMIF